MTKPLQRWAAERGILRKPAAEPEPEPPRWEADVFETQLAKVKEMGRLKAIEAGQTPQSKTTAMGQIAWVKFMEKTHREYVERKASKSPDDTPPTPTDGDYRGERE